MLTLGHSLGYISYLWCTYIHIICNMGRSDLPDMHAFTLGHWRVQTSGKSQLPMLHNYVM